MPSIGAGENPYLSYLLYNFYSVFSLYYIRSFIIIGGRVYYYISLAP